MSFPYYQRLHKICREQILDLKDIQLQYLPLALPRPLSDLHYNHLKSTIFCMSHMARNAWSSLAVGPAVLTRLKLGCLYFLKSIITTVHCTQLIKEITRLLVHEKYLCMCVFVFDIYMLLQKAYVFGSSTWSRGVSREARAAGRSEQDLWVRLPVSWGHWVGHHQGVVGAQNTAQWGKKHRQRRNSLWSNAQLKLLLPLKEAVEDFSVRLVRLRYYGDGKGVRGRAVRCSTWRGGWGNRWRQNQRQHDNNEQGGSLFI